MVLFSIGGFEVKSFEKIGGPGGVRTLDLMTASHARSQLRHRPRQTSLTVCNMGPVGCQRRDSLWVLLQNAALFGGGPVVQLRGVNL